MSIQEQARAEAERRWPEPRTLTRGGMVVGFEEGFLAGHEAATRTRVVTTVTELDALPIGSIVLTPGGAAWQKTPDGLWVGVLGVRDALGLKERGYLPARVLYELEETPGK